MTASVKQSTGDESAHRHDQPGTQRYHRQFDSGSDRIDRNDEPDVDQSFGGAEPIALRGEEGEAGIGPERLHRPEAGAEYFRRDTQIHKRISELPEFHAAAPLFCSCFALAPAYRGQCRGPDVKFGLGATGCHGFVGCVSECHNPATAWGQLRISGMRGAICSHAHGISGRSTPDYQLTQRNTSHRAFPRANTTSPPTPITNHRFRFHRSTAFPFNRPASHAPGLGERGYPAPQLSAPLAVYNAVAA